MIWILALTSSRGNGMVLAELINCNPFSVKAKSADMMIIGSMGLRFI